MKRNIITLFLALVVGLGNLPLIQAQEAPYSKAENPLFTSWAEEVSPKNALPEYPRPMMKRDHWKNLNGLWDFQITSKMRGPREYKREILVPYPVESALSGVKETVGADNRVWYKRSFTVDNPYENGHVLLHFGAVDWESDVFINGKHVGKHQGGYDPFTYDITKYIQSSGPQELEVTAWDPTDLGYQPVGKQTHDPRSIWYTAVTGIWQTVWLEFVPQSYIKDLKITPQLDHSRVKVEVCANHVSQHYQVKVIAKDGNQKVGTSIGFHDNRLFVELDHPKLWSPQHPFLYDLKVQLLDEKGNGVDQVESYFGMRKISLGKGKGGYTRLFLNNKPLFQLGPLDQGWWPDGLYTAPTDEALKYDIKVTKDLGFNMLRKHVKVEPQRFYYWCDKMGILVWQDMPSGDMRPGRIPCRSEASAEQYKKEYKNLIQDFYNHPSIVMWVPFNEGWGQFQTCEIVKMTKKLDPTRLVDNASGWTDRQVGDVHDIHSYPGPDMPETEDNRAAVHGEFGGQALVVKDHLWLTDFSRAPGHYKTSRSKEKLQNQYNDLLQKVFPLKEQGLAAAVYTQITDVETEVNGFMTYDRKVIKFDQEHIREIHQRLIHGE
ncbi:hypothetical protein AKJ55_01235 [candidate division MSBL1 archaeon SCGC-AAA382M17]|uniref:Beta-galactosidase n=1 Tax=candidate division MSBL1 archaeon SCGC-AAA382M17 TaxID=1698284 RepID=A0ABR5TJH6_9EURY|nr:hypothetical protein AKJ55_01235 [candidate division MSBL1 archaeon SCGC-AAA382M17]